MQITLIETQIMWHQVHWCWPLANQVIRRKVVLTGEKSNWLAEAEMFRLNKRYVNLCPSKMQKGALIGCAFLTLWSRRDSNSRPNNSPMGFLHAYSQLDCRKRKGKRQPDPILILCGFRPQVETPLGLFLPDDASFTAL